MDLYDFFYSRRLEKSFRYYVRLMLKKKREETIKAAMKHGEYDAIKGMLRDYD